MIVVDGKRIFTLLSCLFKPFFWPLKMIFFFFLTLVLPSVCLAVVVPPSSKSLASAASSSASVASSKNGNYAAEFPPVRVSSSNGAFYLISQRHKDKRSSAMLTSRYQPYFKRSSAPLPAVQRPEQEVRTIIPSIKFNCVVLFLNRSLLFFGSFISVRYLAFSHLF